MTQLNLWHQGNLSLLQALDAMPHPAKRAWQILAYGPDKYHLGRLSRDESASEDEVGRADLAPEKGVYEARLFDGSSELRWLRTPGGTGQGQAVYLSPTEIGPAGWAEDAPLSELEEKEGRYLLHDGGSLNYCEYLGPSPGEAGEKHGNLTVLEHLLRSVQRKST